MSFAAISGAYLFVVGVAIQGYRARTLLNSDLLWCSFRMVDKTLNQSEAETADSLISLTGVTPDVAAALNGKGISAVQQIASMDPVALAVRSGLPFDYVLNLSAQSQAWCCLGSTVANLAPLGLGDARALANLSERVERTPPDDEAQAILERLLRQRVWTRMCSGRRSGISPQNLIRSSYLSLRVIRSFGKVEGEASAKRKFKAYPIGYFHIDIAEVRTAQGKLYLLVAIDRTSKFAFVELHEKVARRTAGDFLRRLIAAVPYKVHTVLTDNGTHFTTPGNTSSAAPDIKAALEAGELVWAHAFEYACAQNDIDYRLTKPKHPWTNGQVERMNRTIKDATVKRYFYDTHDQLRGHLRDFVAAYNFARRLKTLRGLTPYEFVSKAWTSEPHRFKLNPLQQMPGLNI
jgi:transposase InsO family protein